jgi:hypothetical protein
MKSWKREIVYPAVGLIVIILAYLVNGVNGAISFFVAWLVCGVALVLDTFSALVAERLAGSKISPTIDTWGIPRGMTYRMALVLCGATIVYLAASESLGAGYWIAIIVFYQVALAVIAFRMAKRQRYRP